MHRSQIPDNLTQSAHSAIVALQARGFGYVFYLRPDHVICNETYNCYNASDFVVEEIHAFGEKASTREMLYAVRMKDGNRGVITGMARELKEIDDIELYCKLMVLWV